MVFFEWFLYFFGESGKVGLVVIFVCDEFVGEVGFL